MPCMTDPQTATEEYNQRTAQLFVYVVTQLKNSVPNAAMKAAQEYWCHTDYTQHLCSLLKNMSSAQISAIVYNPHSKQSRKLADWWEQHQEDDKLHAKNADDDKKRKKLQAQALKKLTVEERKALGF